METKQGRGRVYGWGEGEQPGTGWYLDALGELHERVYDQIRDLPDDALAFVAPKSQMTIGWLVVHLISGEAEWVARLTGSALPGSLASAPPIRAIRPYGETQPGFGSAKDLIELGTHAFETWTRPEAGRLDSREAASAGPLATVGDVLSHLVWHWSFHSGHIGLVRLQWGSEYEWRFAP
jgi:uncharacterized damage-inducible protein DinB